MAPSPVKPGQSFGELALGIGSIAEGIGNVIRGVKGMEPAPMGMATRALSDYFGQKQDTTLERILDRLFAETQAQFDRKEREPSPEYRTQHTACLAPPQTSPRASSTVHFYGAHVLPARLLSLILLIQISPIWFSLSAWVIFLPKTLR
jgi:hypothetical protein